MHKFVLSMVSSSLLLAIMTAGASAQNWRQPNPDQPNGYHASEAQSHYHGKYHEPAQPLNGYHSSEARSHYGGSKFEPSSGWNHESNSGPGSAFSHASYSGGGFGSAYSNASAFQNGGPENSYSERLGRANRWQQNYSHLAAAGYMPGGGGTAYSGASGYPSGFANRLTYEPMIQRETNMRERAIQNIEDGQGGFNRVYR
jgi:hypothetical protein